MGRDSHLMRRKVAAVIHRIEIILIRESLSHLNQGNQLLVEICQASDTDVDTILEFIEPFVQRELLLPRDADEIRRLAKTGFVAREDERVIGFASVDIYSRKMAEIQCLAVHSNHQNRGIGRMLVVACIKLAKREGILELMAISSSDEFLKQCGFDYSLPNQKRALFYRFDQNTTD